MDIDEKKSQLRYEKEYRSSSSSNDIPLTHVLAMIPIILLSVAAGFYTGLQENADTKQAATDYSQGITHLFIDGYRITFLPSDHPEIQGNDGFTYEKPDHDIYIEKGLSLERTLTVCDHELLHNLGIGEEHHDFIRRNDERVKSDVCRKLKEKLIKLEGLPR